MPPFKHPSTKIVFEYWASLNGGHPPDARLLDPIAIPKLMPYVLMLTRCFEENGKGRFIHRFAGTGVCDFVGIELTGLPFEKYLPKAMLASAELNLISILKVPCGRWNTSVTRSAAGRVSEVEYLSLPLCDGAGEPDRIMVFMAVLNTQGFGNTSALVEKRVESGWIDLGSGVPKGQGNLEKPPNSAVS